MLEQLINLVKENAGEAIINNQAIPNELNNSAIETVAQSIFGGLQNQAASGNMTEIAGLFQQGGSLLNNPIVSQLINTVSGSVASKFGVSGDQAQNIASSLLPSVMNQLVTKTNDPSDTSIDITSVLQSVSGNSGLDVSGILGSLKNGGGSDLTGMLGNILGR